MAKKIKLTAEACVNTKAAARRCNKLAAAAADTIRNHEEYRARDLGRAYRANFYWPMLNRVGAAQMLAHLVLKNTSEAYRRDFAAHMSKAPVALAQDMVNRTPEAYVLANSQAFTLELVAVAKTNLEAFRAIAGVTPSFDTAEIQEAA